MKLKIRRLFGVAIRGPLLISLAMTARAADLYWDGTDLGLNADGGAGTWNTTNSNWDTLSAGGSNAVWSNATPDNAFFTGVGGAVSLGTAITAGTVNVQGPSYTFSGSTLTADSINVSAGLATTFGTVAGRVSNTVAINGSAGSVLNWSGGGSIATVNLNSGILRNGTTANSATIHIGTGGLLEWNVTNPTPTAGNATNIVLNRGVFRTMGSLAHGHVGALTLNGGMLDFNAGSYNGESLQLNNNVTAGSGGFTGTSWILQTTGDNTNRGLALKGARTFTINSINELRVQAELENSDAGSDSLTKAGDGRMILLNTSSYTGGTTINGGTLQLGDFSTAGTGTGTAIANGINGGTGTVTINASGTLAASHAIGTSTTYLSNLLAGSGTLRVDGAGHFGLSGNTNTFTGTVNMRSSGQLHGGLTLDYTTQNNNKLGASAILNLNGGNLRVLGNASAATSQTVGEINVLGGSLITLTPGAGQTATLTATAFNQSGSGMLTLRSAGTLGTTANLNIGAATPGRWATTQNTSEQNTAFLTKDGSNNAIALQFTAAAATSSEAAGTGTLASQGTSSVYLVNSAQTITSSLTIDSLASQNDVFINNGAVLTLNGGGLIQRNAAHWIQTSSGTRGAITTGLGSGELFITSGMAEGADFRINTDIIDNGLTPAILVKGGTGQLLLGNGGANSYTGGTIINSGRLQLTNVGALGTGNVTVRPGGQLWLNAGSGTFARNLTLSGIGSADGSANNFGALRIESSPTLSGTLTVNDHARITLGTSGGTVGFSGAVSGNGDIELRSSAGGLSYAVFSNASNTFSGRWIVRDGNSTLRVASDAALGAVPAAFRNDSIILDGGRLQFGSTSAGASFTLDANRGISLPNAGVTGFFHVWGSTTMTIAGGVSGPGNLEKSDGGTLVLQGLNTNTGNVRVAGGVLTLSSGGSFTQSNNLQLAATMNIGPGASVLVRNQLITSDASGGTTTLNQTGGDLSVLGSNVTDERTNAVVISHWGSATTYNHSAGTFNVPNAPVMFGWDGTATWNISGTATANLRGIFGQNRNNAATLNLTGGRLNIGELGIYQLGSNKLIKLGAGTVGALSNWSSSLNNFRLSDATSGVTFDPSGRTITLTGILANETAVNGKLNLNGEGTLILGGVNTYTGGTSIARGTLQLNNSSGLGAATNALTVNGGTLNLNANSITTGTLEGSGGTITDNSAGAGTTTLTIGQTANASFSGSIQNGANKNLAFVKNGGGNLTLAGSNNFSGGTTLNTGTLTVSGTLGSGAVSAAAASTLAITGSGTIAGNIALAPTAVFDVSGRASTFTLGSGQSLTAGRTSSPANDILGNFATGSGSVINILSGAGTVGTLTTTGNLTFGGGTVNFDLSSAVASGNDAVMIGGVLNLSSLTTLAFNRIDGTLSNGSYVLVQGSGAVTGLLGNLTTTGLISGTTRQTFDLSTTSVTNALTLDVAGSAATLEWNHAATTGTWSIDPADANWNNTTGSINPDRYYDADNVGFFDISGESGQLIALEGTLTPATVAVNNTAAGTAYTLNGSGKITGATGLVKSGGGLLVLGNTGGNDFTGATTISAGTLRVGNASAISQTSAITIASGAVFDVNGLNVTVPSMAGTGSVLSNASAGTLTVATSGTAAVSALLADGSGTLALEKTGTGTAVLTNSNTSTGGTTITAGTLQLGDGGTSGSVSGGITNNANLALNRSDSFVFGNAVSGSGTLSQIGSGTARITGPLTHSGGTTIAAGTLQLGDGGASGSLAGNITNNATFAINRSDNVTLNNVISGSGVFRQIGSGTTTLTGTSSFTGAVDVSAGRLVTSAAANLGSGTSALTISNAAVFQSTASYTLGRSIAIGSGGGSIEVDSATTLTRNGGFAGGNTLIKTGEGTLRFQGYGGGAFAGSLVINDGSVTFAGGAFNGNIGLSAITVNNGGILISQSGAAHSLGGYIASTPTLTINSGGSYLVGQEQYINTLNLAGGSVLAQPGGANPEIRTDDNFQVNATSGSSTWTANLSGVQQNFRFAVAAAASVTVSGNISGGRSLVKSGDGLMTLTGSSNTYSAGTDVNAGTLLVNNTSGSGTGTGAVTVAADAFLGGDGTITGALSLSGTLLPGQGGTTDRTLTINGNVSTTAGSVISFTIDSMSNHDQLIIGGSNSIGLGNADLDVTFDNALTFTSLASGEGADFLAAISSNDFTSINGSWFRLIEGNTSGMFANVTGTLTSGELGFLGLSGTQYAYDADNGQRFWVAEGSTYLVAIPEPRAALLGGVGLLLLLRRRRF